MQENNVEKRASFFPSGVPGAIPIGIAVVGIILLYFWLSADAAQDLTLRLPNEQDFIESDEVGRGIIKGELVRLDGAPADLPGAWPRFRGANFDAIGDVETALVSAPAPTGYKAVTLASSWPDEGPEVLWSKELGEGFASAAVLDGRVYIIDYDQENEADLIRCMSLDDGSDIWNYSYPVKIKRYHGMSRTVPAVTEKYIVTIGPKCHVTCLDSMAGEFRWMLDLVKDYGAEVPEWYAGQCPLIDNGKAIIAPAGEVLMMAVDCETGEIVWQTPNPNKWKMTHSSIMPAEFMGERMYVYCASAGVVGVSAEDGSILWEYPDWKIRLANVASPLVVGDGKIFLSGGYNSGAMMIQLIRENDEIIVEEVFRLDAKVFGSEQHTPIFYNDHIYGIRPDKQLVCLDLNGNVVWTSSRTNRFGPRGLGPYSIADGKIFVLDDEGTLTLAQANTTGYIQLAQAKVLEGPDAWGPMAFAAGRLIIRDMNRMICLDVSE
jgi:outer membrane protein assembly factor BamB